MTNKEASYNISHFKQSSKTSLALIIWFIICFAAIQSPGWIIADRVEPLVLGLPFLFFWAILWWILLLLTMIYVALRGQ